MDILPCIILHDIFILLPITQKQECISVCKKWAYIMNTSGLFHTVSIRYNVSIFEKFIAKIKDQPRMGLQVSNLDVTGSIPGDYNDRELLRLFPNLKILKVNVKDKKDEIPENAPLHHEGLYLECIEDAVQFELTKLVLAFPLSSLVSLTLDFSYENNTVKTSNSVIPLLKNAPSLTKLCLLYVEVSSNLFQVIHTNLVALKSLIMCNCIPLEPYITLNITPALTLESFVLDMQNFNDKQAVQWLHRFNQMYPNLESLKIVELDLLSIDELDGYPGIFQKLTSIHLTNLEDEYDMLASFFDLLDKDACQIKELKLDLEDSDFLNVFTKSNQSKHIEKLELRGAIETTGFRWLKDLISLKSLTLDYYTSQDQISYVSPGRAVHLNELLGACPPTVTSVSVLLMKINHDSNVNQQFPSIKCLKLLYSLVPLIDIDRFVTMCLPNLNTLSLKLSTDAAHKVPILAFPDHHFFTLCFYMPNIKFPYFRLVTSEKMRCFPTLISGSDYTILGDTLPQVRVKEGPIATVHCSSTKNLYINDKRACF